MAVVPNTRGLWNLLFVSRRIEERLPTGIFGALLPLILVPAGLGLASVLGLSYYTAAHAVFVLPLAMALYYLAWKYGVGSLNRILELD